MQGKYFGSPLQRYLPLLAFLTIYTVTCALGAVFFLLDFEYFVKLYKYFSGAKIPDLRGHERFVSIILLFVAPLAMALGYIFSTSSRLVSLLPQTRRTAFSEDLSQFWLALVFFIVSALFAFHALWAGGSFENMTAWVDYASYVQARWDLFRELAYFDFVNIYILCPLTAAWLIIVTPFSGAKRVLMILLITLLILLFSVLLFQKKSVVVSMLILGGVLSIWMLYRKPDLAKKTFLSCFIVASFCYFTLAVLPAYSVASRTIQQAQDTDTAITDGRGASSSYWQQDLSANYCDKFRKYSYQELVKNLPEAGKERCKDMLELKKLSSELGLEGRGSAIALYAIMAPLTRTSIPALFYPIVFPEHHSFYGLDVGQDILGYGHMPDDGIVVWKHMNQDISGSTAAPFQFVLYSQVGLTYAIVGSFVIGILLGFAWILSQISLPPVVHSLAGAGVVLFAIYLAIDSARNAIFASYGILWFGLAVLAIWGVSRLLNIILEKVAIAR